MLVPSEWLREYCDPELANAEVAELLNAAGLEVARIERPGLESPDGFVVGRVLTAEPHPNAERLRVCTVDDGSDRPRTIVCGAPNVAAGQTVAVARPGALLPDGRRLGAARLRGVESEGMILAEDELGIGPDHSGILVIDNGAPPGARLVDVLPLVQDVFDLEISPNRPDALAVYGVARELHALSGAPLAPDPTDTDAPAKGGGDAGDHARVEVLDPSICLRFTARIFEDVSVAPSPAWLKARLTAAGQRPISNVVDITNYVMLLTGQPLHAFDLDRVRGSRIIVRRAGPGERMTTLDGIDRELDENIALVCDAEGPSGIAGIMGGQFSEVSASTGRVLMEAATWVGPNIMASSTRLGVRTEASARFEKQLHPDQALDAQRLASRLMIELCGARLVPGTLDAYPHPLGPRQVELRPSRVARLLGAPIPVEEITSSLERLGFGVAEREDSTLDVSVPSYRDSDVQREADLIEEVARIHGLDRLPTTLPARRGAVGRLSRRDRLRRRLEDDLRGRGLIEVVSYSFTSPKSLSRLRLDPLKALRLANPLSEDHSVMRPSLLPGLAEAAAHSRAHGQAAFRLFESAHVYEPPRESDGDGSARVANASPAREAHHLAALVSETSPPGWRSAGQEADFYAIKALVEALLEVARVDWRAVPSEDPFLHPARQASIVVEAGPLGFVGELHPTVAADWDIERAAAFEFDFDAVARLAGGAATYRDLTSYPSLLQDIAVVVPDGVSADGVVAAVRRGGAPLLASVEPFDLYRGEQLGEGEKSLALRLEFRSSERTLTDGDVASARQSIEAALADLGGRLRA